MISVISLAVVASNAYPGRIRTTNAKKICEQMSMDPAITECDGILLCPRDVQGSWRDKINEAIKTKHPGVCVMYIYTKDTEADLVNTECKMQVKRIKDSTIHDVINQYMGENIIKAGKNYVTSKDFVDPGITGEVVQGSKNADVIDDGMILVEEELDQINYIDRDENGNPVAQPQPQMQAAPAEEEEILLEEETPETLDIPKFDTSMYDSKESVPLSNEPVVMNPLENAVPPTQSNNTKIEERLRGINSIQDWEIYKQNLNKESIVSHLIEENTEYVGLVEYLDVLDEQIRAVWRDNTYSPTEKFNKIKEIGLQRSVKRAAVNSINVEKAISIITTITMSAARTVDEKIDNIDLALYKISTSKEAIMDTAALDKMIQNRTQLQLDLLSIGRDIVDLYKSMDLLVDEMIRSLDQDLPSANEFINQHVKPLGVQIFTPTNTAALAMKLTQALQENRLTASQMETKVKNLISMLFKLCEDDEEIIRYQQNVINQLKANRVEDVVIVDSLLKKCLRLYIGPKDSGVHATAITWCGILSRRNNTLLIDLSGRSKFKTYGIQPMDISDFMSNRVEKQFLCVEATQKLNLDELQKFVLELKSRLNYYPCINIILDQDDVEELNQLSNDALTVHYITNCSAQSLDKMTEISQYSVTSNIARKLVLIDPPISPVMIAERIKVDPTITQAIMLPNLPIIRACELTHEHAYEYKDVVSIFEEAFR